MFNTKVPKDSIHKEPTIMSKPYLDTIVMLNLDMSL